MFTVEAKLSQEIFQNSLYTSPQERLFQKSPIAKSLKSPVTNYSMKEKKNIYKLITRFSIISKKAKSINEILRMRKKYFKKTVTDKYNIAINTSS